MTIKEVSKQFKISQDTLRYYERMGMIPPVQRTAGGIRNYGEDDLKWVELVLCMRSAGLPIEVMVEYVKLYQEGEHTIPDRLQLLVAQREVLMKQKKQIEDTIAHLDYKISRYKIAEETGKLVRDK